jgi:4-hydroxy-tetrahydrodipicolinate synthase
MSGDDATLLLRGVIPVVSMPFAADGRVDHDALAVEAAHLLEAGVHGLAFGFGSELPRLTERERDEALRTLVAAAGGRVPVVAAVVTESIPAARERCEAAAALGADAIMVTPPHAGAAGVRAFLATLADETPRPLVIQDAPAATGVTLGEDLLVDLAAHDRVAALKLESPDAVTCIARVAARAHGRATLLGGSGGVELLAELRSGSAGTMPGAGYAALFVRIWDAFRAGDDATAGSSFGLLQPLLVLASRSGDTFLGIQKELLVRAGVLRDATLRQPSEPLADRVLAELDLLEARLASVVGGARA